MRLLDLCDIKYGYAFDSKRFTDNPIYPPLVRIRDVKRGFSETFYAGEYSKEYLLHKGDLLIGMDTLHEGDFVIGKIGTIGNPVFIPARDDYTLSANIVLVQPNRELVSPYFLKYSFESDFVERQFAEAKNSTSQAAFGIQKVRTVKVMNPDLDVQNKFENFVQQVDKSKSKIQKSLEETQLLFDSLMQKYFG